MDLFICYSPLQIKIALKIIDINNIKNYEVFFFTHRNTPQNRFYFDKISRNAKKSEYYLVDKRFPAYFRDIKNKFKFRQYDNIYLASIDNIFPQLILTSAKFNGLRTFDDGTANITYDSLYYRCNRSTLQSLLYYIFGSRFTLTNIKELISEHYSIYKGKKNISDNVIYIDLFENEKTKIRDESYLLKDECNVLLGTCYRYVTDSESEVKRLMKINFFNMSDIKCIPHPMEDNEVFEFDSNDCLIAEDIILRLKLKYKVVNLYGIASSALIPFIECDWCNVYTIKSQLFYSECNQLSSELVDLGVKVFDLDVT
tara:strand:- start:9837 stop:10775 length:939 start_codon:yes stop_codon:yes gene_type:complete